jgi:ribosomal-protein-alanine N-acetyltransferase
MTPADVPAVLQMEQEIFSQPWTEGILRDELGSSSRRYLVAVDEADRILGYGGAMLVAEDCHITNLAVREELRGRGLGSRLVLALIEEGLSAGAVNLTLEVRVGNAEARRLYQRFGFAPVGLRHNYYRDEDALIMWVIDVDSADYRARLDEIGKWLS